MVPLVSAGAVLSELRKRRLRDPVSLMSELEEFRSDTWDAWREVMSRVTRIVRELYVIAGRGSGKSRTIAVLACVFAMRHYRRAAGERIYVGIFGPDRKQARITFRYVVGLLHSLPDMEGMIQNEQKESIDLTNGVTIEVLTAGKAARSRSYALVVIEEAAFLPKEDSANPDVELVRALRPALARVHGSLLAVVSSPYAQRGVLWKAFKRYGSGGEAYGDPTVVLVHEPTEKLNPSFDREEIRKAYEDDPVAAATEYGAAFRQDVESYVTLEAVEACVARGRHSLPRQVGLEYRAFVDPSGGRDDSMTLAIGHVVGDKIVLDYAIEREAPFSPEAVVRDLATTLIGYGVTTVHGDRYAGEWPREMFTKHGVEYEPASKAKSDLYRDALPLLNSGRVELLDLARLKTQIVGLERRTARGGRDIIDHMPGAHDDVANAVLGLVAEMALVGGEESPVW